MKVPEVCSVRFALHLGKMWDEDKRKEINLVWHKLDGTSDVFRTPSPGEAEYGE